MSTTRTVDIQVPVLARVEGEGALDLNIVGGRIAQLRLRIYEPPRYFEKFLEGREWRELPEVVARICGICPVAYQMSAVQATEAAFGMTITPWVRDMRRVLYCGEWLESHALHIHMLAAPDFLGCQGVVDLARIAPEAVRRGLRLQGLGNDIIRLFGGRSVHPVGARAGGFWHAPEVRAVHELRARLQAALPDAQALLAWTAALPLPEDAQDFVSVALRHPDEYPMNEGRIVSSAGLDIGHAEFEAHFRETHAPHSTALHAHLHGQPYLVGPLARLNLNLDRLDAETRAALARTGIAFPSRNMFHSIVARAAEMLYALREAVRLLQDYSLPDSPHAACEPCAGTGHGCTEAPRGILWHRYVFDARGLITQARIVPPTSQNQARIEADLAASLQAFGLEHDDAALRLRAETVIRNYDPCISCATHFLRLRTERR